MLVSDVVGEAWRKQHPKPKQLPIPKQSKRKARAKPKKRANPKPFNAPKPDELSCWCLRHAVRALCASVGAVRWPM